MCEKSVKSTVLRSILVFSLIVSLIVVFLSDYIISFSSLTPKEWMDKPCIYRIGDVIRHGATRMEWSKDIGRKCIVYNYPTSIAAQYIRRTNKTYDLDVINQIVDKKTIQMNFAPFSFSLCARETPLFYLIAWRA